MDHPSTRLLARYALGDIKDEAELEAFEDHLLECDECRRKALAVDLIGALPPEEEGRVLLHISSNAQEGTVALCGDKSARNIVAQALAGGLEPSVVCPKCFALLRGAANRHIN